MSFLRHQIKKRVFQFVDTISDSALFAGIVLIGGLGSSWYMVEAGSLLTTRSIGPWVIWTAEARPDADPYTQAHFARSSSLNLSTSVAGTYTARTDSDGLRLHSSCEYAIEGEDLPADWWSLSVFDERGRLIANPARRYTFTSDTVALDADGTFKVALAREARPGNWLPTAGAGRLVLVLKVLTYNAATAAQITDSDEITPPVIRRVYCR